MAEDYHQRLTDWLRLQLPDADDVRVEGLDRIEFGHSAEMMVLTVVRAESGAQRRLDVVLRLRPPAPGLLEPYDLARQFTILRALQASAVKAPRALWLEESGAVLGRPFYVMERLEGQVFERVIPPELACDPQRIRRMSESMIEQIAAIHLVDLKATGLDSLADGRGYLDRELAHWSSEMRRFARGPLPALERLLAELHERQPAQSSTITLVHGDPKPGNFAFLGEEVSAVFDWELAQLGDPLADVGWAELLWMSPASFTGLPSSLNVDEFISRYEALTGTKTAHREWYRALQAFKMAVILLVGGALFDTGVSDDIRLGEMSRAVPMLTQMGLDEFGVKDVLDHGPVSARRQPLAPVGRVIESDIGP